MQKETDANNSKKEVSRRDILKGAGVGVFGLNTIGNKLGVNHGDASLSAKALLRPEPVKVEIVQVTGVSPIVQQYLKEVAAGNDTVTSKNNFANALTAYFQTKQQLNVNVVYDSAGTCQAPISGGWDLVTFKSAPSDGFKTVVLKEDFFTAIKAGIVVTITDINLLVTNNLFSQEAGYKNNLKSPTQATQSFTDYMIKASAAWFSLAAIGNYPEYQLAPQIPVNTNNTVSQGMAGWFAASYVNFKAQMQSDVAVMQQVSPQKGNFESDAFSNFVAISEGIVQPARVSANSTSGAMGNGQIFTVTNFGKNAWYPATLPTLTGFTSVQS